MTTDMDLIKDSDKDRLNMDKKSIGHSKLIDLTLASSKERGKMEA